LIAAILWLSRSASKDILSNISLRIKSGAAIKTPWLEVEAINISTHSDINSLPGITSKPNTEDREGERQRYYAEKIGFF
jgi:hypothetical protein